MHSAVIKPTATPRRARLLLLSGIVLLSALLGAGAVYYLNTRPPVLSPGCAEVLAAPANLLANAAFARGGADVAVASWTISGTLGSEAADGRLAVPGGTDLLAGRVAVHPGKHYCYDVATGGSGHGQVMIHWDDIRLNEIARSDLPPRRAGEVLRGEFVAPPDAAYARLRLRAIDDQPTFHAPILSEAGARLESWPDGAQAALAFSFDWESAMGTSIHSRTGHDPAFALDRGLKMRSGADILLDLFRPAGLQATFYATGYNLLDGNQAHHKYAGDPIYGFGPSQGWQTTWWMTHTWYSDDPFGTAKTDPAWYYGDQADRLAAAGQEIGSHTFGHLYGRATSREFMIADMDEWVAALKGRGLPPARSFAFPYRSSNDIFASFYAVLDAHGFDSLTRIHSADLADRFALYASPRYLRGVLTIMPDFLLGADSGDPADGGGEEVTGGAGGRAIIGELIARHGATSFWTHPQQLTIPTVRTAWTDTINAAVAARAAGDLWIAPVSTIVHYWRAVAQVDLTETVDGGTRHIRLTSRATEPLAGVTVRLPRAARSVQIDHATAPQRFPDRVIVPHLTPGQTVEIAVTE